MLQVRTLDSIDRTWNYTQRHSAVLTGDFTCCACEHEVELPDGSGTVRIACDK